MVQKVRRTPLRWLLPPSHILCSFLHSDHQHTVLDIQGVGTSYTDPAIVSRQQLKYGYTDTGYNGLQSFFQKHVCSPVCKALRLRRVDGNVLPHPTGIKPKAPPTCPPCPPNPPSPDPKARRCSLPCGFTVEAAAPTDQAVDTEV